MERDLERRLRATLDSLLDPHVLLEAVRDDSDEIVDFVHADANSAACAFSRCDRERLIGRSLREILPDPEATMAFDASKRVVESGEPLVLDEVPLRLEGRGEPVERRLDVRAVPLDDGLVLTWRDVTDRAATVSALRTAERRYRALSETASDLLYRTDAQGIIRWVSPSLTGILGWEPTEFVGHSILEFGFEDDVQRLRQLRDAAYGGARAWGSDELPLLVRIFDKDGKLHPMSVFVTRDVDSDSGALLGLIVGMRDVTELLRVRDEAARAEQQAEDDRRALDRAMIGMAIVSPEGEVLHANPAMEQMLAASGGSLEGRRLEEWLHQDDVIMRLNHGRLSVPSDMPSVRQRRHFLTSTGRSVWADAWVTPLQDDEDVARRWLVQMVDVSAEVQANDALQRSVRRFRLLAENASDIVYQTDPNGVIEWISPSVSEVLGWDPDLLIGTQSATLVAPEDLALMTGKGGPVIRGVREHGVLAQFLTVRGGRRWMSVNARPILDRDDDVAGVVVGLRDVTSEQAAHEELAQTQQRFRLAMDAAAQGIALTDGAGLLVDINPAAAEVLGSPAPDLVGRDFDEALTAHLGPCSSVDRHEHIRKTRDGQIWVDHVTSTLSGEDGEVIYVVHQFIDETSDRRWQQELEHWASHDVLTGVANRRSVIDHLERLLRASDQPADSDGIAVLFCDVDNLKDLNDSYGHAVGDAVLSVIADRMARSLRRGDRVGRIGGDEFVVVLDGVESSDELARIAEKLRVVVSEPIAVLDRMVNTTISIGATFATQDAQSALEQADAALYRAKAEGRDRVAMSA